MTDQEYTFAAIGFIESSHKEKFGVPRQSLIAKSSSAKVVLKKQLQPEFALDGLAGFSHVWLIGVFHQAAPSRKKFKVHPPRARGKTVGVFASRSPHRPNPISLTLVELEKIEGNVLYIRGADLIDGTPILDIKPYLSEVESQPNARQGWVTDAEDLTLEVIIDCEIPSGFSDTDQLHLVEILSQDPRPQSRRGNTNKHGVWINEWNVIFFVDGNTTHVVEIQSRAAANFVRGDKNTRAD